MEVRINLNESVKFKLSERGKEIYRHRYDGYGFEYDREPKLDDDGCAEQILDMESIKECEQLFEDTVSGEYPIYTLTEKGLKEFEKYFD